MSKRGHAPIPMGKADKSHCSHWQYCRRCGRVLLKNRESQREWQQACPADSDKEQAY